jgi:hypothetical protein
VDERVVADGALPAATLGPCETGHRWEGKEGSNSVGRAAERGCWCRKERDTVPAEGVAQGGMDLVGGRKCKMRRSDMQGSICMG